MSWWDHLKPQIEEHLREMRFNGYYADDVQVILSGDNWLQDEQFKRVRFNHESAEFTLQGLLDTLSLVIGDEGIDAIKGSLKYNILALSKQFQRPVEIELEEEVA